MIDSLVKSIENLGLVGLTLFIQLTLVLATALCLCWAFGRRPAAKHFVALSAIAYIAISPLVVLLPCTPWFVVPLDLTGLGAVSLIEAAAESPRENITREQDLAERRPTAEPFVELDRPLPVESFLAIKTAIIRPL